MLCFDCQSYCVLVTWPFINQFVASLNAHFFIHNVKVNQDWGNTSLDLACARPQMRTSHVHMGIAQTVLGELVLWTVKQCCDVPLCHPASPPPIYPPFIWNKNSVWSEEAGRHILSCVGPPSPRKKPAQRESFLSSWDSDVSLLSFFTLGMSGRSEGICWEWWNGEMQ